MGRQIGNRKSSNPTPSVLHVRARKQLIRAIRDNRPILVRMEDNVAIRPATFDEVLKAIKSYDKAIWVPDVLDVCGLSWGTKCVIRRP